MLISAVTVLLFVFSVLGLMLYPKTDNKMNALKLAVMGIMAVFCYLSFCAFIYNKIGIVIGLPSTCAALVIINLFLWVRIIYLKRVQKLFLQIWDLIWFVVFAVFVIYIALHMFTPELKLQYYNIDAAPHFLYANEIVQTGQLYRFTYFSAYIDALFIMIFSPALMPVMYYKAFIIADVFMHILELWMFYYLVLTVSERKIVKVFAPIITLGYFWGYPAYSFMEGHFVYWSTGVMIYIFILYTLLLIEKNRQLLKYTIPLLVLGLYANTCCNKLFVPTNTLAVMAVLAVLVGEKYWDKISKKYFLIAVGCAVLFLAAIAGIYVYLWRDMFATLINDLRIHGGIYSSLFADFIFFLPVWICIIYYAVRKLYIQRTILISGICMLLITLGMYGMWRLGYMSSYYYYKIYYNVWLFCWLFVVVVLELMANEKKLTWFFSYLGMILLLAWITLSDYDTKVAEEHENYKSWNATTQMLSIYHYNANNLRLNYEQFQISDQALDTYNYAMNVLQEMKVRIVSESKNTIEWHDAIDYWHARYEEGYCLKEYALTELLAELDYNRVQAIIVNRSEEKYQLYMDYFEHCKMIYINGDSAILMPAGERWLEISSDIYDVSEEKQELMLYVRENLDGQRVPLLAAQEAYYDYMMYYMLSSNLSDDVYPWKFVSALDELLSEEEALQVLVERNISNLSENEIHYALLLYDDAFYQQTERFFAELPVVYENDAGKIIAIDMEDR